MNYKVNYYCLTHMGKCRNKNQDNFICDGKFWASEEESVDFPLMGYLTKKHPAMLGVFDGMGGEECGEIASLLAAKCASKVIIGRKPLNDLMKLCKDANEEICNYRAENNIIAMGTTAALLAFTDKEIALCNIGDSKIFRFSEKKMEQISIDHVAIAAYGLKPSLSQNLGISPSEMVIEPYMARGRYNVGDIYLICSDGLTDMVPEENITKILLETPFCTAASNLLNAALEKGGKDNITVILCKVERERKRLFHGILNLIDNRGN